MDKSEYKARGISLTNRQYELLMPLAIKQGHMSRSRVVQELIEREAERLNAEQWLEREEEKRGAA